MAGIAVAAALFWALDTSRRSGKPTTELFNTESRTPADGLAGLPRDYTNIPKLGPALPGDLGRPILRAQEKGRPVTPPAIQTPRVDPAEERRLAEMEAARLAKLFTDSRGERATGGQSRVLLVWNRLIMPDGTSVVLERMQGTDPQGFSGIEDGVDYHWGQLFKAAALSTLLGVGTQLSIDDESEIARAIRESAQDSVEDVGQQIVRLQLNIQPTLTVRPGFPIRIVVQRDLIMRPWDATKEPT